MPDLVAMIQPLCTAAAVAAAVLLFCSWPRRRPNARRVTVGWVLGVSIGFALGCWQLDVRLHWPLQDDQDRWLLVLVPLVIGVELVAAFSPGARTLAWTLRCLIAAAAAPILLHRSIYLADLAGPNSREWTAAQAGLILGGLAVALAGVWAALALLARRVSTPALPLALSLALGGGAITVMLSGYFTGGQLGLPLASALAGTTLASRVLAAPADCSGALGVSVVGLFALLVTGRFFSDLSTPHAIVLFGAPLLAWIADLPFLRRRNPGIRGVVVIILVAAPIAFVVQHAHGKSRSAAEGWVRVDG